MRINLLRRGLFLVLGGISLMILLTPFSRADEDVAEKTPEEISSQSTTTEAAKPRPPAPQGMGTLDVDATNCNSPMQGCPSDHICHLDGKCYLQAVDCLEGMYKNPKTGECLVLPEDPEEKKRREEEEAEEERRRRERERNNRKRTGCKSGEGLRFPDGSFLCVSKNPNECDVKMGETCLVSPCAKGRFESEKRADGTSIGYCVPEEKIKCAQDDQDCKKKKAEREAKKKAIIDKCLRMKDHYYMAGQCVHVPKKEAKSIEECSGDKECEKKFLLGAERPPLEYIDFLPVPVPEFMPLPTLCTQGQPTPKQFCQTELGTTNAYCESSSGECKQCEDTIEGCPGFVAEELVCGQGSLDWKMVKMWFVRVTGLCSYDLYIGSPTGYRNYANEYNHDVGVSGHEGAKHENPEATNVTSDGETIVSGNTASNDTAEYYLTSFGELNIIDEATKDLPEQRICKKFFAFDATAEPTVPGVSCQATA